ncbi:hypothetical protein [Streptomyces sp. NPDC002845]
MLLPGNRPATPSVPAVPAMHARPDDRSERAEDLADVELALHATQVPRVPPDIAAELDRWLRRGSAHLIDE